MKLCYVIVTYRPKKKVLQSLIDTLGETDVIVVDNTDNNRGYSGGANVGVHQALEQGFEWLVLVNDDVTVTKSALIKFLNIIKVSQPAVIGPVAGKIDSLRWTTAVSAPKMDYIDGAFTAIHRDIFRTIGKFFESYFIYYEDVDFCIRVKHAGFSLVWFPIEGIVHKGSLTFGRGSFEHQYYLARNHLLFVERQAPMRVKMYEFVRLPKTLYEHIVRREWGGLLGIFHYFIRRFGKL